jgi:hypothetical protein
MPDIGGVQRREAIRLRGNEVPEVPLEHGPIGDGKVSDRDAAG